MLIGGGGLVEAQTFSSMVAALVIVATLFGNAVSFGDRIFNAVIGALLLVILCAALMAAGVISAP
ncbi:MAG: hypothetical protein AAFR16_09750 [Pseudomonadota bacterium]